MEATTGRPACSSSALLKGLFGTAFCGGEQVTMEVTTALDTRVENCRVRFFGDGRAPQCIQCSTYAC